MDNIDDDDAETDSSIMAAMGFGNFGTQKKSKQDKDISNILSLGADGTAKRQKPNPVPKRGSGANNTPLSTRRPQTKGIKTRTMTDLIQMTPVEGNHEDDPGYEDSDTEDEVPKPTDDTTTRTFIAAISSPSYSILQTSSGLKALEYPLPARPSSLAASDISDSIAAVDPKHPPPSRRLSNGDYAYFLPSFIIDDPWAGLIAVPLPEKEKR